MPVDLIKYAFAAGELSPQYYGRGDLEKYDLGLAEALNWFIDYRGGLSTRPGTEFLDFVMRDDEETRFFSFKYAPNLANTYVVLFGVNYIRFLQDGAYVLETGVVGVTAITNNSQGEVTFPAHGFTTGDWFYISDVLGMTQLNGKLVAITVINVNKFSLQDQFGDPLSTTLFGAYVGGGLFERVYTIASPYAPQHLTNLNGKQRRDYIRFTHASYPIYNLKRVDHTDWTMTIEHVGNAVVAPTGLTGNGQGTSDAQVGFVVTAVFDDGTESAGSDMLIIVNIDNYTQATGGAQISWDKVTGAVYYKVYRTIVSTLFTSGINYGGITKGDQVGYVGRSVAPHFSDNNIIPNFAQAPPNNFNPFANRAIDKIEITAGGTGYDKATTTAVITGAPGVGFVGRAIVDDNGIVIGVLIINRGHDYVSPVVTFPTGGGTGAAADATVTSGSNNNPRVSTPFQQRQWYAATGNNPLTVYASRPGQFSNMDISQIVADSDAIEQDVDSEEVAPILHLIDVRGGLLVMSQTGVWLLRAPSSFGAALTSDDIIADPQLARGAANVKPVVIDNDVLYVEGKAPIVRLLSYSDPAKSFVPQDMSILSNHLFSTSKRIVRMDFAQNPHNLVLTFKTDGDIAAFAFVKEQDVFAWTPWRTNGIVKDLCVVHETGRDSTYLMVRRKINGRWTKFIERIASREFNDVEEAWCVDCGLETTSVYPDAEITFGQVTGLNITVSSDVPIFAIGDVGKVIRAGGGKAVVIGFTNNKHIKVDIQRDLTDLVGSIPKPSASGTWSMNSTFTTISGLEHLEGERVKILADGNVIADKIVVDGEVDLGMTASLARAGQGFQCKAKTLPLTAAQAVIEGKRQSVVGTAVRVFDTRGLKTGASLDKLYPMRERRDEPFGEAIRLQSELKHTLIESEFDSNGQTYFVQDDPLPATIIGLITTVDLGDTSGKDTDD